MNRRDHLGLSISSGDPESVERYGRALTAFHGYTGNPLALVDAALERDPEFLAGLALRAGLLLTSSERRAVPELRSTVTRAEALIAAGSGNARERAHVAAGRAWLDGDFAGATDRYNRLALEHPRDALALQVAHLCNFFFGRAAWLRDHVGAALPHFSPDEPTHGYLLGMYAFGLEENGEYERAERAGRSALLHDPRDAWAVHAVAHCFEMRGQAASGIDWMESRVDDWAPDNMIAVHNFWHTALFYLDLGDHARVLELYDRKLRGGRSEVSLDLVDASALLWRLMLGGLDVQERCVELASVYRRVEEEGYYAFNDLHALMAYLGAGDAADTERVLERLAQAARGTGTNAELARDIGLPAARGFAAFARGDYGHTVELLFALRLHAHRFGGSHAQRDVLDATLVEAALRDRQIALAQSLIEARVARKPESPAARRAHFRAFGALADEASARVALESAERLEAQQRAQLAAARGTASERAA